MFTLEQSLKKKDNIIQRLQYQCDQMKEVKLAAGTIVLEKFVL